MRDLAQQRGAAKASRNVRLQSLESYIDGESGNLAESMEQAGHVMMDLVTSADTKLLEVGQGVQKRLDTLAAKSATGDYQLLLSLADADKTLDAVDEHDQLLLSWAQEHAKGTQEWRKHLVQHLADMGVDLSSELGEIEAETHHFNAQLQSAESKSAGEAGEFIADTEHKEEDAIDAANKATAETLSRLKASANNQEIEAMGKLQAAGESAANDLKHASDDTKALEAEAAAAAAANAETTAEANAANDATDGVVEATKEQAHDARSQLLTGIKSMQSGLLQEKAHEVVLGPRARAALRDNAALTAHHGRLLQQLHSAVYTLAPKLPERAWAALKENAALAAHHGQLLRQLHQTQEAMRAGRLVL